MSLNPDLNPKGDSHRYRPGFKTACIMVDKVYFQCQQRECIENVKVRIPHAVCLSLNF